MHFQDAAGALELAALVLAALGLEFAELIDGLVELAREPGVVEAEPGEGVVRVDDIKLDGGLFVGRICGAVAGCA